MDVVHVWLIPVDQPAAVHPELAAVLDPDERQRAAAFVLPEHRRRFVAAHGAARVILGARLGLAAGRIRWQRGRYGKPELAGDPPPLRVNLAHSDDLAVLALTEDRRIGVDLQRLPAQLDVIRMSARFFPAAEARFVAAAGESVERARRFGWLWARKEACVKAAGGRLTEGLRLPVRAAGPALVRDPGGPLPGPYLVDDLPVPAEFHAAVAADGEQPYQVVRHWWPAPAAGWSVKSSVDSSDSDPTVVQHA